MAKKRIDEERYSLIKELLNSDIAVGKVQELLGISSSTISYVRRIHNFEDYCQLRDEHTAKPKPQPDVKEVGIGEVMLQLVGILEDMNEKIDLLLAK